MTAPFLTNAGLAKLLAASPENPVKVKHLAVDAGQGTASQSMTQLFNEVHRVEVPNPVRAPGDDAALLFTGEISENVGGWTIYGFGLFSDANELLAYWQLETPIVKPPVDSALKMAIAPDMYLKLSNAAETELIITASTLFRHNATTERDAADAHPMSAITGLSDALADIATDIANKDDQNVKLTGDQSIAGIKKFTDRIDTMHIKAADGSGEIYLTDGAIMIRTSAGGREAQVLLDPANGMIDFGAMKMIGDGSGIFPATTTRAGVVRIGSGLSITDGVLSSISVGAGQTRQDMTANRAVATTYTNSTGRVIEVLVVLEYSVLSSFVYLVLGGNNIKLRDGENEYIQVTFSVLPGETYRLTEGEIVTWLEVR